MAPQGQVQYNRDVIRRNVRIHCDDITKKGRNSRQSMWDTVQRARAAHRAANPEGVIEPLRWPLPDVQQLGQSSTGPPYMPQNPRGRAGATLLNATQESNTERARIAARGAQGPGPAAPAVAPAAQGPAPAPAPALAVAAPAPALAVAAPAPAVPIPPGMQDVAYGGWLFTAITVSGTLRILAHTMAELVLRSQPFLPWELGASRQISRFYVLDRPDRWRVHPLGVDNDPELARHITADYFGGNMLDLQVEVCPPALVPAAAAGAIAGRGGAADREELYPGGEELYVGGEELYAGGEELYADGTLRGQRGLCRPEVGSVVHSGVSLEPDSAILAFEERGHCGAKEGYAVPKVVSVVYSGVILVEPDSAIQAFEGQADVQRHRGAVETCLTFEVQHYSTQSLSATHHDLRGAKKKTATSTGSTTSTATTIPVLSSSSTSTAISTEKVTVLVPNTQNFIARVTFPEAISTNSLSSQSRVVLRTPKRRQASPAVLRASCSFEGTPGRSMPPSPLRHSVSSISLNPQSPFQSTPISASTSAQQQYDSEPATDTEGLMEDLWLPEECKVAVKSGRNRSINQFSSALRDMVTNAANDIESITLFQDPLPDPKRMQMILESIWTNAERKFAADVARNNKIDAYHLVAHTRPPNIPCKKESGGTIPVRPKLLDTIHPGPGQMAIAEGQVYLGGSAKRVDFNFTSANGTYTRLLRQWKAFPTSIQDNLLNVIRAEIDLKALGAQLHADLQKAEEDNLITATVDKEVSMAWKKLSYDDAEQTIGVYAFEVDDLHGESRSWDAGEVNLDAEDGEDDEEEEHREAENGEEDREEEGKDGEEDEEDEEDEENEEDQEDQED
ncbi:hypothetical protein BGX38DRAFT_1279144 [Terfezia claveryi]|nr:hypothetical protein BGX38DRAFT_1279144 [Terfezia claveryi]